METKPKRLGDIPIQELYPEAEKVAMEDILGREIIIEGMTTLAGDKGDFAVFIFHFESEDKVNSVSCGGWKVVQRLTEAKQKNWFPIAAKIVKVGRTYQVE